MKAPRVRLLVLVLLALGAGLHACGGADVGSGGGSVSGGAAQAGASGPARVVRVVDGDTLKVRLADGRRKTVRVLGIDTPEVKRPATPIECGGPQASAAMRRLAMTGSGFRARGRDVVLVQDRRGDRVDRYGRVLAYVDAGGRDLGGALVREGWAEVYAFRGRRFGRRAGYERDEAAAASARLGVHGRCGGDFHTPAR